MLDGQLPLESTASREEAEAIATLAYIYGLPLVLMDVSREVMTSVPAPRGLKAPLNQFIHLRQFPDYTLHEVVSPNVDTLYSTAWLDLSREPVVLAVPEMGKRYYLMQMLDAWTNVFAAPGTRTTGSGAGAFLIVGPGWKGTVPPGVRTIAAPTNLVWILGRTYTAGAHDYDAVRALQDQYHLVPLSAWGRPYAPPAQVPVDTSADVQTAPVDQTSRLSASAFLTRLAGLMGPNPPAEDDEPMVKRLRMIGVVPGESFALDRLPPPLSAAVASGVAAGRARLEALSKAPPQNLVNGWAIERRVGRYATNYMLRAHVALVGLGANLPEDAIYPMAMVDIEGAKLTGANRYLLHFPADALPPVDAFWSVTMYDDRHFLVKNPIDRYALGDRAPMHFNPDGSLDLFIQNADPGGDRHANWLPAPAEGFNLLMRLYSPRKAILEGTWSPPPIVRL
jgi:hypothetical protein